MASAGRVAAVGAVASILLAINEVPAWPGWLVLIVVAFAAAWRFVPGFWLTVALGAAGGALAGLAILGPGLRVAMRMVATMEPSITPEFSIGGTVFVILVAGGVMGGIFGIVGNLLRDAMNLHSYFASGIVLGSVLTAMLFVVFRGEFDFGGGLLLNLSLFGFVSMVYGLAAMRIVDHFSLRLASEPQLEIVPQV